MRILLENQTQENFQSNQAFQLRYTPDEVEEKFKNIVRNHMKKGSF